MVLGAGAVVTRGFSKVIETEGAVMGADTVDVTTSAEAA
jgi:hypothetical protein